MAIRSLFIAGCLLLAAPAFAAPPPGADMTMAPWFHSLRVPGTGNLCCDVSDCRHYPVRADGTHYWVLFDDRWLVVPTEAVSDREDNPTGDYVTCILHPTRLLDQRRARRPSRPMPGQGPSNLKPSADVVLISGTADIRSYRVLAR